MDRTAGPARLPEIDYVYLVQTDTTVGFVSRDSSRLNAIKERPADKPFLKTFAALRAYKKSGRIPSKFKREIRRSKRTTYIIAGQAFRIVPQGTYHRFLRPFDWLYSTSANAAGERYNPHFAKAHADIIVEDSRGLFESAPSQIYKLNHHTKSRVR